MDASDRGADARTFNQSVRSSGAAVAPASSDCLAGSAGAFLLRLRPPFSRAGRYAGARNAILLPVRNGGAHAERPAAEFRRDAAAGWLRNRSLRQNASGAV